jgi:hypothetical protein
MREKYFNAVIFFLSNKHTPYRAMVGIICFILSLFVLQIDYTFADVRPFTLTWTLPFLGERGYVYIYAYLEHFSHHYLDYKVWIEKNMIVRCSMFLCLGDLVGPCTSKSYRKYDSCQAKLIVCFAYVVFSLLWLRRHKFLLQYFWKLWFIIIIFLDVGTDMPQWSRKMFNRDFNKLHTYKLEGSLEIFVGCLFLIFYILIMLLFYLLDRLSRLMNSKTFLQKSSLDFYLWGQRHSKFWGGNQFRYYSIHWIIALNFDRFNNDYIFGRLVS